MRFKDSLLTIMGLFLAVAVVFATPDTEQLPTSDAYQLIDTEQPNETGQVVHFEPAKQPRTYEVEDDGTGDLLAFYQTGSGTTGDGSGGSPPTDDLTFLEAVWAYIMENWIVTILGVMAFLKVLVNLTPTDVDNKIFAWLDRLINAIVPNRRTDGKTHPNQ